MFPNNNITKLIIVCADDTQKYGSYLIQLISTKDDTEEKSVGLKDGSVEAVLWTEKDYKANEPTLPASSHILFIGSSKLIKMKAANMNTVYEQYGMQFKSLGCQAVITVDKKLPTKEEYQGFTELCKKYEKTFEKLKFQIFDSENKKIAVATLLASFAHIPFAFVGLAFSAKTKAQLLDQRYTMLTLYTYMELLAKFIEG